MVYSSNMAHVVIEVVDSVAPVTTCTLNSKMQDRSSGSGWYTSDITITLTAIDDISGIAATYYKVDNNSWIEYTNPIKITDDGEHTFYYYSVDNAGNKEEEKSTMFKIDKTNPTISFKQPICGYLYLMGKEILPLKRTVIIGKAMVTTTAYDETSGIERVKFYVDDELKTTLIAEPFEWLWDETVIGKRTIKAVVYDKAGNMATDEQEVWIFNFQNTQKNVLRYNDNFRRTLKADKMYGIPGFETILLIGVVVMLLILRKRRKANF